MLIYFLRGTLPWRKIRAPADPPGFSTAATPTDASALIHAYNPVSATWNLIRDAKLAHEELLTVGLPPEFDVLYRYARGLEFDDLPDYEGLRKLFRGLAERVGVEYDGLYDWSVCGKESESEGSDVTAPKKFGHGRRSISEGSGTRGRYCAACNAKRRT